MNDFEAVVRLPVETAAQRLLGCQIIRELDGREYVCTIVETEAYRQDDAASHSYRGQTPRTAVMFGPPGRLYDYFTYGMHYCCNIVTGEKGEASAVLIRAVEPLGDTQELQIRRRRSGIELTNGPAKLCQALDITKVQNGHDLRQAPLQLLIRPALASKDIATTTRIGISRAQDKPWRYYIKGSPYVSVTAKNCV